MEKAQNGKGMGIKMKKLLFIVNPRAGKSMIKNKILDIIDMFTKSGYQVTVYPTQARGAAVRLVEENTEVYDLIVCSGGDGTLDEVVTGMMKSEVRIPIGYIPAGSTNDFAKSLGISSDSRKAAMEIIKGRPFPCDIGRFNADFFVYIAAFGAFTEVSYNTSQQTKNMMGHLAYFLEGAKSLSMIKSYYVMVEYDGQKLEGNYIFGMVTNSLSVGGFKRFRENEVEFDDGLFEGMFIKQPQNPLDLQAIIGALLLNDLNESHMNFFKACKVVITSKEKISWTIDGEYGGEHEEVVIANETKAIEIIRNMDISPALKG